MHLQWKQPHKHTHTLQHNYTHTHRIRGESKVDPIWSQIRGDGEWCWRSTGFKREREEKTALPLSGKTVTSQIGRREVEGKWGGCELPLINLATLKLYISNTRSHVHTKTTCQQMHARTYPQRYVDAELLWHAKNKSAMSSYLNGKQLLAAKSICVIMMWSCGALAVRSIRNKLIFS